ncbi:hypothetical protein [Alkalibacillus haloalkaliphilus]|uniref:hypothetical protein n=1 Tax=Alkalibacillus haloalkaliphilus TaxID=94136 RepID=UPI0029364D7D|nr:hypothetical protein [Alkalibacillus haloalkaliphilus]MDV2582337.1 hypothetical protein [Alkalibacillus haloalkaliphilus]
MTWMDVAYKVLKFYFIIYTAVSLFFITEGMVYLISFLISLPAVYAILFLNENKTANILMFTYAVSLLVYPFIAYDQYGIGAVFSVILFVPIIIYFLFLYKEDHL